MKRVGWDPRKLAKSNFLLAQNEDISKTFVHAEFRQVHFFYAARTMIPQFPGLFRYCCKTSIGGVRNSNKCRRYVYEYHTTVDRKLVMTASLETSLHMRMLSQ